jgi:hypothetical protein
MKYRPGVNYQPISEVQIASIVREVRYGVSNLEQLRLMLDEAAEQFINDHYWQQFLSPSKLDKQLIRIGKAAKKLSNWLLSGDKRARDAARRLELALNAAKDNFELEAILNVGMGGTRDDRFSPLLHTLAACRT